jgi:hypothetical protein
MLRGLFFPKLHSKASLSESDPVRSRIAAWLSIRLKYPSEAPRRHGFRRSANRLALLNSPRRPRLSIIGEWAGKAALAALTAAN